MVSPLIKVMIKVFCEKIKWETLNMALMKINEENMECLCHVEQGYIMIIMIVSSRDS